MDVKTLAVLLSAVLQDLSAISKLHKRTMPVKCGNSVLFVMADRGKFVLQV